MRYTNESGRSMVEMLGVLAIIGVLSIGGIAGYSKAMNKYKINKTTDQVSMLVANIRTLFSSQNDYSGLTVKNAINFGVVPNDMYTSEEAEKEDPKLTNAFGGEVTIETAKARSGGRDEDAFVITYTNLTDEACVSMLTGDWGSGQGSGLIAVAGGSDVNNTTLKEIGIGGGSTTAGLSQGGISVAADDGNDDPVATAGSIIAVPGGADGKASVPVPVTTAVEVCNGGGAGNTVSWKYY